MILNAKFNSYWNCISTLILMLLIGLTSSFAQANQSNIHFDDPEEVIRDLYSQVTFPAGTTPDWTYVRNLFFPQATVVMRVSKNETSALSLDGWILDFVNFIHNRNIESTGFEEKIIRMETILFGDIAHVIVLYSSYIPGVSKAPKEGIDSFHLSRRDGRWMIVSLLNELPSEDRPMPSLFKN